MTTNKIENENEESKRLKIINSILKCPHRDLDQILQIHTEAQKTDPLFYAKLAVWHKEKGEIRDHNEVFTGLLCTDEILEHRETGLALLRQFPPYMKERVKGLIKGKRVKIRHKLDEKMLRNGKSINKVKIEEKVVGLKKNLPNSFKTEIKTYLQWLESNSKRFDDVVLHNFNSIIGLYASLRIEIGKRAKEILFNRNIPEDSSLSIIKKILAANTPVEKAELIVENKIPYTVAVSLIKNMTPSILTSLISVMTPQEIMNNMASLKEHGAYENQSLKAMIMEKLSKAEKKKGVSALKSKVAKEAANTDDKEINDQLDKIADEGIKKVATIKVPTAIIVDKSGSMEIAIETGKQVAAMVSGATESNLYVIATDTMAREITAEGKTLTAWEKAFKSLRANGGTSIGAGVDFLLRKKYYVEQIVIITDEHENREPFINTALEKYQKEMNVFPNVVVIKVKGSEYGITDVFKRNLSKVAGDYTTFDMGNDNNYYALPSLIPLLAQNSKLDLLYEIMDTELLKRIPFEKLYKKV